MEANHLGAYSIRTSVPFFSPRFTERSLTPWRFDLVAWLCLILSSKKAYDVSNVLWRNQVPVGLRPASNIYAQQRPRPVN